MSAQKPTVVEKFWKDNKIFEKSMDSRKEGETYTFYDGPPTANGKPHIGHDEIVVVCYIRMLHVSPETNGR